MSKFALISSYKRYSLGLAAVGATTMLLVFNNCGKINSQAAGNSGNSNETISSSNAPNTPVDPSNPYVLNCITSSDGMKVSMSLRSSVQQSTGGANKINSLDWDQKEDLVVTLDNRCVEDNRFSDPILSYIPAEKLNLGDERSIYVIKKEDVTNLQLFIQSALASDCLLSANKNHIIKVSVDGPDTYFGSLTHLLPATSNKVAINAPRTVIDGIMAYVEDINFRGNDSTVKVAVIDTGVEITNPDLSPMFARDKSGNIIGYNTTSSPAGPVTGDSGFHGTHVSGLIGAQYYNSIGVSGVYGRHLSLYPMRTSNDGETMTLSSIVDALKQAILNKVDVVNMSLGTPGDYKEIRDEINNALAAGITVVVAAGNDGATLGGANPTYPAMYSTATNGLITVGSLDLTSKSLSGFSNRSSTYVDILAPGSNANIGILSTIPYNYNIPAGQTKGPGYGSGLDTAQGTQIIQGTSMATPIVAGAVAAVISMAKSRGKILPNTKIKEWLRGAGSSKDATFSTFAAGGSYLDLGKFSSYAMSQMSSLANSGGGSSGITINLQPSPRQAVVGENVSLSVSATGSGSLNYQWYFNDVAITGATSNVLNLTNLQVAQGGSYKVVVSLGAGTVTSNAAAVKVALNYCSSN